MSGIGTEDIEGYQSFRIREIDAPVRITTRDIYGLPGAHLFVEDVPFGAFHHHHAVSGLAEVYFRSVQDGMKVTVGHMVFIADFTRVYDAGSENQVALFIRDAQFV